MLLQYPEYVVCQKFQYCVFTASPNRFSRLVIVPRGIGVLYLIFSMDPT